MGLEKIHAPSDESIRRAARFLAQGQLVGIPTETVYGLAANALDPVAVARIYTAKGRPPSNPLIVHLADASQLPLVTGQPLGEAIRSQIEKLTPFWPGPLTLVLPRGAAVPDCVTAGRDTVAVRVPANEIARRLIRECGFPLAAPSANRSTYVSPTTAAHVLDGLGDHVAMILDGGDCDCGIESTIVRLEGDSATLLRPGWITREQLESRLGCAVHLHAVTSDVDPELIAPGMMRDHYAPRTRMRLVGQLGSMELPSRCGRIAFSKLPDAEAKRYFVVDALSESGDLEAVAKNLFAAIRRMDSMGLELIVVDECGTEGIGRAIMDRLNRATG